MSEVTATILGAIIGALLGGVVGSWAAYLFTKSASEGDRHTELQYTIYKKVEAIKNLLIAFQKNMISRDTIHERSARASEEILVALIRSGLSKDEKKKVLHAINGKWENPESVKKLQQLADELLKKLDPEFADAASELLNELGIKPEDIDPIVLANKSGGKSSWRSDDGRADGQVKTGIREPNHVRESVSDHSCPGAIRVNTYPLVPATAAKLPAAISSLKLLYTLA